MAHEHVHRHPLEPDIARALNAVRSIVRSFRVNTRMIESKLGISAAQLYVLQQLNERPALSLSDIAERTGTHQSSASVVVRRLTERGFVQRSTAKADRRRVELELTDLGRDLLTRAPNTIQGDLIAGSKAMSDAERRQLAELLERWLQHAEIDNSSPPMLGEDGES